MSADLGPLLRFLRSAAPMWVGMIFIAAGSVASIGSLGEWADQRRFEREAVADQAEVIATSLERATRDGNPTTRYLVTYRFAPESGAPIERTEEVPVELWETLAEGDTLAVRYLPQAPETARAGPGNPAWVPLLVAGATALAAIFGAFIAWPSWRRIGVLLRVQRRGVAAPAAVIGVAPIGVRVNRVPQWRIRYEFRDRLGLAQQGLSDNLHPADAAEWQVGDQGTVRYDPTRPADSVWLGKT